MEAERKDIKKMFGISQTTITMHREKKIPIDDIYFMFMKLETVRQRKNYLYSLEISTKYKDAIWTAYINKQKILKKATETMAYDFLAYISGSTV